ncbi:coiled-coil domain-containing protein 86 [Carettochelys insculpta]|uniref:coiled-coil domain-containing protein 86 n=1 Tax=Carettochelys insculpta TaxID=44489 RepID=UPI003EBFEF8C
MEPARGEEAGMQLRWGRGLRARGLEADPSLAGPQEEPSAPPLGPGDGQAGAPGEHGCSETLAAALTPTPTLQRRTPSKKRKEALAVPKGKPKSGRVWKDPGKRRFSHMIQDKPLRTSWERKMKERQEKKIVKDFARHLQEEKQREREEKRQRREENLKRRLENERKAEIVQVIRNPLKLKRAKKKQLRRIEKRDTLVLLQKRQAQRKEAKE